MKAGVQSRHLTGWVDDEQLRIVVVQVFDGGILDGAVHPFGLAVFRGIGPLDQFLFLKTPGMLELGEAVFDAALVADPIEDVVESVSVTGMAGEPDTVSVSTVWMA